MEDSTAFYTLKGYQINEAGAELSPTMEDYLEMICRMMLELPVVRPGALAKRLNVRPSSATKIIQQLKEAKLITAERYGYIRVTEYGREIGTYLLHRHDVLQRFLCALNRSSDELEQVEKIEHFLNQKTIENLAALADSMEQTDSLASPPHTPPPTV